MRALIIVKCFDAVTMKPICARGGYIETADNIHHRRFARARRPHNGNEITLVDVQINTAKRLKGILTAAKNFGNPAQFYKPRHSACASSPVTIFAPAFSADPVTIVRVPSVAPAVTVIFSSSPSSPRM